MCHPIVVVWCRLQIKVWSEMCEVLEATMTHYEQQVRLSQQFHAKFVRLSSHSDVKLTKLTNDNQVWLRFTVTAVVARPDGRVSKPVEPGATF